MFQAKENAHKQRNYVIYERVINGDPSGIRTPDTLIKSQVLICLYWRSYAVFKNSGLDCGIEFRLKRAETTENRSSGF